MAEMEMTVRQEHSGEIEAIRCVNRLAFNRDAEALLVDCLRCDNALILSLVATVGSSIVGHVAFSRMMVQFDSDQWSAAGIGPIAISPEFQRRGIGSALIRSGLDNLRLKNVPVVFVLGDPTYYARFGFEPAWNHFLRWEKSGPMDAFQVVEILPGGIQSSGIASYHPCFDDV